MVFAIVPSVVEQGAALEHELRDKVQNRPLAALQLVLPQAQSPSLMEVPSEMLQTFKHLERSPPPHVQLNSDIKREEINIKLESEVMDLIDHQQKQIKTLPLIVCCTFSFV